jgi:hypothetical protein
MKNFWLDRKKPIWMTIRSSYLGMLPSEATLEPLDADLPPWNTECYNGYDHDGFYEDNNAGPGDWDI